MALLRPDGGCHGVSRAGQAVCILEPELPPPHTPTVDHSGQGDYYSGVPPPEEEGSLWSWLTGEDDEPRRGESANYNNEDEDTFTVRFILSYLRTGN